MLRFFISQARCNSLAQNYNLFRIATELDASEAARREAVAPWREAEAALREASALRAAQSAARHTKELNQVREAVRQSIVAEELMRRKRVSLEQRRTNALAASQREAVAAAKQAVLEAAGARKAAEAERQALAAQLAWREKRAAEAQALHSAQSLGDPRALGEQAVLHAQAELAQARALRERQRKEVLAQRKRERLAQAAIMETQHHALQRTVMGLLERVDAARARAQRNALAAAQQQQVVRVAALLRIVSPRVKSAPWSVVRILGLCIAGFIDGDSGMAEGGDGEAPSGAAAPGDGTGMADSGPSSSSSSSSSSATSASGSGSSSDTGAGNAPRHLGSGLTSDDPDEAAFVKKRKKRELTLQQKENNKLARQKRNDVIKIKKRREKLEQLTREGKLNTRLGYELTGKRDSEGRIGAALWDHNVEMAKKRKREALEDARPMTQAEYVRQRRLGLPQVVPHHVAAARRRKRAAAHNSNDSSLDGDGDAEDEEVAPKQQQALDDEIMAPALAAHCAALAAGNKVKKAPYVAKYLRENGYDYITTHDWRLFAGAKECAPSPCPPRPRPPGPSS